MTITPSRTTPTTTGTTPLRRRRTAAISVGLAALAAVIAVTVWLTTGSSSTAPSSPTVGTHTTAQLPAARPAQGGHLAP